MNRKHITFIIGLTLVPTFLLAQGWRSNGCWANGFPGFFGGGWMMILWTVLLIGVVAMIVRVFSRSGSKNLASDSGLAILYERYAKGEISRDEFLKTKDDLT